MVVRRAHCMSAVVERNEDGARRARCSRCRTRDRLRERGRQAFHFAETCNRFGSRHVGVRRQRHARASADAIPYASHAAGSGNRLRVLGKTRPVRTPCGHRDGASVEACRRATPCRTAPAIMRRHATAGHAPRRTTAIDIKKPAQAARVSANRCVTPATQAVNACSASSVSHSDVCRSCSFRFSPSPPRSTTMKSLTSPSAISG